MSYPHYRNRHDPPADMAVHGDSRCASTERFRCRACWLDVCWCKGHSGASRLDEALCDDCSVLLTDGEHRRVRVFETEQRRARAGVTQLSHEAMWWMSWTTALRIIRARRARAA